MQVFSVDLAVSSQHVFFNSTVEENILQRLVFVKSWTVTQTLFKLLDGRVDELEEHRMTSFSDGLIA